VDEASPTCTPGRSFKHCTPRVREPQGCLETYDSANVLPNSYVPSRTDTYHRA
jgi:hypothetical protein